MNSSTWQQLTAAHWQNITPDAWGQVLFADFDPMFPPVSLDSLGFNQDSNFVYIPLASLLPRELSWEKFSIPQWQNMTAAQWQSIGLIPYMATVSDNQLFYLLLLKLQGANLPAHQVKSSGNFWVVESRALAHIDSFMPDKY